MQKEFEVIKKFLDVHSVKYEMIEHEPVYTSDQAAAVRNFDLRTGVKSLVFKITKNGNHDIVLVLVPGDRKLDYKKLTEITGAENIKLADPKEVLERTGCEVGSCHPFGNLAGLRTYMDKRILENKTIAFNAGLHTITITMNPYDLANLTKPEIADLSK